MTETCLWIVLDHLLPFYIIDCQQIPWNVTDHLWSSPAPSGGVDLYSGSHIVFENVTWAGGNIYWIIFSIFWALVSSCSSRTSVLHLYFSFNLFVLFNFCTVTFPFLERVKQLWHEPSFCHCFQFRCSFYFVEFNLICLVVTFRFLSLSFFRPFTWFN